MYTFVCVCLMCAHVCVALHTEAYVCMMPVCGSFHVAHVCVVCLCSQLVSVRIPVDICI